MSKRYLSAVKTSKLLRAALKAAFPGVKFSVRSRGAIDVDYLDGPPLEAVELVAKRYAGAYFDGMTDYQGSIYHELDGEPVGLLSTFVFVKRNMSVAALEAGLEKARAAGAYGVDGLEVSAGVYIGAYLVEPSGHGGRVGVPDGSAMMHSQAAIARWFDHGRPAAELEPASMVEADRLKVVGNDGYRG